MTPPVLSLLFFGSGVIVITVFVLLKRWDRVSRSWLYFSIAVSLYAYGYAFFSNNDVDLETALLTARIGTTSAAVIPLVWFYFVTQFLEIHQGKIYWIILPLTLVFVVFGMTDWFIPSVAPAKGYRHYPMPGPLYYLHALNFLSTVSYGFFLMMRSFLKETSDKSKREIFSLFLATLVGFVAGGSEFSLILLRDKGFDLTVFLFAFPLLMAYAMTRHKVFDLEEIVQAFQKDKLAAIGMLSASINHEIRNPLFVIKGFNESLLAQLKSGALNKLSNEERDRRIGEILGKTIEQVDRASEISQRLTDFSKAARDSLEEQIDLNQVVIDVLSFIKYGLEMDRIKIEKNIDPAMSILANRKQMEQIFLNLIMNACQAMPKGGELKIVGHQNDTCARIEVSDNGEGIPPDKISRIFEPFYTTKDQGTGLGLYVTEQLVEKNGGCISVESFPQMGTTFVLEFGKERQSTRQPK